MRGYIKHEIQGALTFSFDKHIIIAAEFAFKWLQ